MPRISRCARVSDRADGSASGVAVRRRARRSCTCWNCCGVIPTGAINPSARRKQSAKRLPVPARLCLWRPDELPDLGANSGPANPAGSPQPSRGPSATPPANGKTLWKCPALDSGKNGPSWRLRFVSFSATGLPSFHRVRGIRLRGCRTGHELLASGPGIGQVPGAKRRKPFRQTPPS